MASNILGIDPGLSGGFAWLYDGKIAKAWNMPVFAVVNGRKKRNHLDTEAIMEIMGKDKFDFAVIERQQAYEGQGVSTTFTTGKNFGILLGLLDGLGITIKNVTPQAWKKALKLSTDKQLSFDLATKLFPGAAHFWTRKKDDGVAEAALLAHYGERL